MTGCTDLRAEAAVAMLGGRPVPPEVAEHTAACPACADELRELTGVAVLLSTAREAHAAALDEVEEAPPPQLLQRLLARMHAERRRRRVLTWGLAAAAAAVVAVPAGIAFGWHEGREGTPVAAAPQGRLVAAGSASTPGGVKADITVRAAGAGWGSEVGVEPYGLRAGSSCRVEVVSRSGEVSDLLTWTVPREYRGVGEIGELNRATPVAWREISWVRLVDEGSGQVLLRVPITPA